MNKYRSVVGLVVFVLLSCISYYLLAPSLQPTSPLTVYQDERLYDKKLLTNCYYNIFADSLLVLNFNFPFYNNVDVLKDLYEGVFGRVLACGPAPTAFMNGRGPDIVFDVEQGHFSYHCMGLAIDRYPNYKGYFYGQDDMIINWWTFAGLDRNKIWHGTKVIDWRQDAFEEPIMKNWIWWPSYMGIVACQNYYKTLMALAENGWASFDAKPVNTTLKDAKSVFDFYMKNGGGRPRCAKGWSDFFYIPDHQSQLFRNLSYIAYNNNLYLEIAVHNILRSMDSIENFVLVDGLYMPDKGVVGYSTDVFWKLYNHQIAFIHPYKFYTAQRFYSGSKLKHDVIRFKQKLTDCVEKKRST